MKGLKLALSNTQLGPCLFSRLNLTDKDISKIIIRFLIRLSKPSDFSLALCEAWIPLNQKIWSLFVYTNNLPICEREMGTLSAGDQD